MALGRETEAACRVEEEGIRRYDDFVQTSGKVNCEALICTQFYKAKTSQRNNNDDDWIGFNSTVRGVLNSLDTCQPEQN